MQSLCMVLRDLGPDFNLKASKPPDGPQIGLIYLGIAKLKFGLLVARRFSLQGFDNFQS